MAAWDLTMIAKDGQLIATLDSPDQNAAGIPTTEARLDGDILVVKVGVAAATYQARIDRVQHTLNGDWVQRGASYPLKLSRRAESSAD